MGAAEAKAPYEAVREGVARLCARYPGAIGRSSTTARVSRGVRARADRGRLPRRADPGGIWRRRPQLVRRGGDPGGDPSHGCNGAACHAQMYIMGTILRHGIGRQKQTLPAEDRHRRAAAAGVRRHRADQRHRHTSLRTFARSATATTTWSTARRCGPAAREHSDLMLLLARTTPREQDDEAHRGAVDVHRRSCAASLGKGLTIRPIRTMMNHNSTEVFFDNMSVPAENLVGRGGPRLPLHPGRHERRAAADRRGVHRRRQMVPRARPTDYARGAQACSAGRSGRTRASSSRSPAPTRRCGRPN